MQLLLDDASRKAFPNLTKWFQGFIAHPAVKKRFGAMKMCKKALLPEGCEEEGAADELDDLFGDDGDDAEAAKVAAKNAKDAAKKKVKKPVIAQSLVMFEVKPLESDTDLDALAQEIFAIKMDGLYWKTQYKKEPVAFGIFKLIIGVTVEDEKVSVDDL